MRVTVDGGHIPILAAEDQVVAPTVNPVEHGGCDHIKIHPVLRGALVPPFERAGARIQHHDGVGEQIGARAIGLVDVRPGIAHRYEQLASGNVQGHCPPDTATAGLRGAGSLPGLGADFLAHGDGIEAPQFASGLGIKGHDPAARARLTAADTHIDHAAPRQGRRCGGFAQARCADDGLPQQLAGRRIQCDQAGIAGAAVYTPVHDGNPAGRRRAAIIIGGIGVAPEQGAVGGIKGHRLAAGAGIDDPVDHDQIRMQGCRAIDLNAAHLAQLRGIGRRDLLQWGEALAIEMIVVGEPLRARTGRLGATDCGEPAAISAARPRTRKVGSDMSPPA